MFTTAIVSSILAFSASALAAPLSERQTTLSPWQVTGVGVFTPSGRPESYPWSTITVNASDPNELNLGTGPDGSPVTVPAGGQALNCQAKWLTGTSPTGHSWPCDPTGQGYWVLELLPGTSGFSTTNFDVKLTRVADRLYQGSQFKKTYQGQGHFEVGDNLAGTCGGSGVCSWGLKADHNPFPIQQAQI